jgi:hypothetical protein
MHARRRAPALGKVSARHSCLWALSLSLGLTGAHAADIPKLQPNAYPSCAKPFATLSPIEKKKLLDAPSNRTAASFLPNLWTTETIPVFLEKNIRDNAKLNAAVINALKYINSMSEAKFYTCTFDALTKNTTIKSAIMITADGGQLCSQRADGCTAEEGMSLAPGKSSKLKDETKAGGTSKPKWKLGPIIGLSESVKDFSEGTIVHELLHAMGMVHLVQTPVAKDFVKFSNAPSIAINFIPREKTYYMKTFDPASIMNYHFYATSTGNIRYVCDKETQDDKPIPVVGGFLVTVKGCKIDKLIDDGSVCLYRPKGCFPKPGKFGFDTTLTIAVEGQRYCMSVLDQAWLSSALVVANAARDSFNVKNTAGCSLP